MNKHRQTAAPMAQPKDSQSAVTPNAHQRKRKCAGVYIIRMIFGIVAIICVIVLTGVQASEWKAIANALFGGITLFEVIRYVVIVLLSMAVGYWIKKPYKVYVKNNSNKSRGSEADEQKAEE